MLVKNWIIWKLLVSCSLLASGCGYRWTPEMRPSIAIPFIPGDEDASFTHEIARTLSASGLVQVSRSPAEYRLEVAFSNANVETIGYRFNPQKVSGQVNQNLVATEGRRSLTIEATVYEGSSEEIAYGPYQITAYVDYDFLDGDSIQDLTFQNRQGERVTVLPFSLGQLEPSHAAQQAATRPLYACLARKLVNALAAEW